MADVEVSKITVKGTSVVSSDTGQRVEKENPEILVVKRKKPEGAK